MPAKKTTRRQAPQAAGQTFPLNELVYWSAKGPTNPNGVWRFGLVKRDSASHTRVLTFDLDQRDAWDLRLVNLPTADTLVHGMGQSDLAGLLSITLEAGKRAGTEQLGESEADLEEHELNLVRPLDRIPEGRLRELVRYAPFMDALVGQLWQTTNPRRFRERARRFYGTVVPLAFGLYRWDEVMHWICCACKKDLIEDAAGFPKIQASLVEKVLLRFLVTPQERRRDYRTFLDQHRNILPKLTSPRDPVIADFRRQHDEDLIQYITTMVGRGLDVGDANLEAIIDPGHWSDATWNALPAVLRTRLNEQLTAQLVRDHCGMPYFDRVLKAIAQAKPELQAYVRELLENRKDDKQAEESLARFEAFIGNQDR